MNTQRAPIRRHAWVGLVAAFALFGQAAQAAAPFTPNEQPRGWVTRPTFSDLDISGGNSVQFRTAYDPSTWEGDVVALDISEFAIILPSSPWGSNSFAHEVDQVSYDTGRKIATLKDDGTAIPFRWASLSATQQASIGDATAGPAILDFVRGDRSNEVPNGLNFRARASAVGDIIQSTLIHWRYNDTTRRLFVGANDGMVHIINAADGMEDFAYIPSMLIPNLKHLAANPYNHYYFVNGGLTASGIRIGASIKTLLAGGLGAGGKGLFCLDVTSVSTADESAAAAKIKWEITSSSTGFANLGYTYGSPRFATINTGVPAVIVGNGYMNSGNGQASLYLINADTGALIQEISTGSGSLASPNGLSTPTLVDSTGDGRVDYAYAGDLDGTMWKFDLTGADTSAYSATAFYVTSPAQAITTAPLVVNSPYGGRMVVFGTGRMLSDDDLTDTSVHYVYGIWDGAPASNAGLIAHTLTEALYGGTIRTRYVDTTLPDFGNVDPAARNLGWKIPLSAGERVVGENPFFNDGRIVLTSTNPTVVNATLPNGANWQNQFEFLTGAQSDSPIFDLNADSFFNDSDKVGSSPLQVPNSKYFDDGVVSQPALVDAALVSYTLFNASTESADTTGGGASSSSSSTSSSSSSTSSSTSSSSSSGGGGDRGVSGGHFDVDIYYRAQNTTTTIQPTDSCQSPVYTACRRSSPDEGEVDTGVCTVPTFDYLLDVNGYITSGCRSGREKYLVTCCQSTTVTTVNYSGFARKVHVHEYDDVYDVTGVNMLNASLTTLNLSNAREIAADTEFKVLVINQYLNPAAKLKIGPLGTWDSVKDYGSQTTAADATSMLNLQPSYTKTNIGNLVFNLPLDAFESKDWWGDGAAVRAGLMPARYACVWSILSTGLPGWGSRDGPNGEHHDGALTIQLIKASTPASAIEMNYSAGGAKYGWRVKRGTDFQSYVLAEYTYYWHHPNELCYGGDGWVQNPPQDFTSDAVPKTPAVGSDDPQDGVFAVIGASSSTSTSSTSSTSTSSTSTSTSSTSTSTTSAGGGDVNSSTSSTTSSTSTSSTSSGGGAEGLATFCINNPGHPICAGTTVRKGSHGRAVWRQIILE